MQAMNGSGVLGIRRMLRVVGCVAALVALSAMTVPSIASATGPKKLIKQTYVGLGDSLAFGYSQQLFNENEKTGEKPSAFEHGYVTDEYEIQNAKMKGRLQYVNDGCPGETSASLIGNNPALLAGINASLAGKIPEPVTGESPCAYHKAGLPLHHEYGGTKSQLESAIETIAVEKAEGTPVKTITLDIGANDQLHKIAQIEAEVKARITKHVTEIAKNQAEEAITKKLEAIAAAEVENFVIEQVLTKAFEETGGVEPAFKKAIEKDAGEYFAAHAAELQALGLQFEGIYEAEHAAELAKEGQELGEKFGLEYQVAHKAELEAEGKALVIQGIVATAGEVGEQIITNETGIIATLKANGFKGKFILVGTYDAYGNDYGTGELLPGSNALLAELNNAERSTFKKGPLKACYSDAQEVFNVGGAQETINMQKWTNMANFTKFEGKANGPDIHATPEGYDVMAKQISTSCKF